VHPMSAPPVPSSTPVGGKVAELIRNKGPKYVAVSLVNVVLGQGLLLMFHSILHVDQTLSNVLAVAISAVPAYYLSRAWVWKKSGKSHFKKEVLPFWIFVVVGLVFSTAMVALTSKIFTDGVPPSELTLAEKLLPNIVNMVSFGLLWVVRFFLMERWFASSPELIEELVGEDFIEAVQGEAAVEAAERAAAERAGTVPSE
jgi:putative flippase GtrA